MRAFAGFSGAIHGRKGGMLTVLTVLLFGLSCNSGSSSPIPSSPPVPGSPPPPPAPPPGPPGSVFATVMIDTTQRFQEILGWEAHAQSGNRFPAFPTWQNPLMDKAVNDGINRLRLELRAGVENPVDYHTQWRAGQISFDQYKASWYVAVNDNADPATINPAGFNFSGTDWFVAEVVLPMKQRLEARGERLYLNLNYVAFFGGGIVHNQSPAEYAELILATFLHLRDQFGLVPDAVEVILEPDTNTLWDGVEIGRAIAATGARLAAAGFRPDFIAPSVTNAANAVPFLNAIVAQPGAMTYLTDVAYHRYRGATQANIAAIAARAKQLNLRTAMLEHIGSDVDDLYVDLTVGQVSAWQQFALAFDDNDNGGHYYIISNGVPVIARRTVALRQYFKYVRRGARRIAATSDQSTARAVGFVNTGGGPVVVVHVDRGGSIGIRGLRPGRYGVSLASGSTYDLPDATAAANGVVTATPQSAGVLTLYYKP